MSEEERKKNEAAVALGRLGGKAGTGRAKARTKSQARAAGRAGAAARWAANRRLIDAAPDLLAACIRATEGFPRPEFGEIDDPVRLQMEAAVRKARKGEICPGCRKE